MDTAPTQPRRTIFIGDVHGCLQELHDLLRKVAYKQGVDKVILVGDLVDKGPLSAETVKFVRTCGFTCIRGNHEDRYIRYKDHEEKKKVVEGWVNPMRPLAGEDLRLYESLSEKDWEFLSSMPMYVQWEDTLVVHAGLIPGIPLTKQSSKYLLNIGGEEEPTHWTSSYRGPYHVIYGHSPTQGGKPRIVSREGYTTFGIDTGCVYGHRLTAMVIDSEIHFESVAARKAYASPKHPSPPWKKAA